MKKELEDKWVHALENEYAHKKGQGSLCHDDKYCCLGVLQMVTDGKVSPEVAYDDNEYHPRLTGEILEEMPHDSYYKWADLNEELAGRLAKLNDSTKTFERVIKLIRVRGHESYEKA